MSKPAEKKGRAEQEEFNGFRPPAIRAIDKLIADHKEDQAEATQAKNKAKKTRERLTALMNEHRDKLRDPDSGDVVYESENGRVELVEKGVDVRIRKPRLVAKSKGAGEEPGDEE